MDSETDFDNRASTDETFLSEAEDFDDVFASALGMISDLRVDSQSLKAEQWNYICRESGWENLKQEDINEVDLAPRRQRPGRRRLLQHRHRCRGANPAGCSGDTAPGRRPPGLPCSPAWRHNAARRDRRGAPRAGRRRLVRSRELAWLARFDRRAAVRPGEVGADVSVELTSHPWAYVTVISESLSHPTSATSALIPSRGEMR